MWPPGSPTNSTSFFAPPIILVAWFAGRRAGLLAALFRVVAWTVADYRLNPALGTHPMLFNGLSRLLVYGVNDHSC